MISYLLSGLFLIVGGIYIDDIVMRWFGVMFICAASIEYIDDKFKV